MPIRFSAAHGQALHGRRGVRTPAPANDNATAPAEAPFPRAALVHFAAHGLASVAAARRKAEDAFFAGDRAAYHHWLGICRSFDRRLARSLSDRFGERSA